MEKFCSTFHYEVEISIQNKLQDSLLLLFDIGGPEIFDNFSLFPPAGPIINEYFCLVLI